MLDKHKQMRFKTKRASGGTTPVATKKIGGNSFTERKSVFTSEITTIDKLGTNMSTENYILMSSNSQPPLVIF